MTQSNDAKISGAADLTPSEQSLLVMRSQFLVQCLDAMDETAVMCQTIRRELSELLYTSTIKRAELQQAGERGRQRYAELKHSARVHKNNLAKTLYDIQARKAGENSLAPGADPMA